MPCAYHRPEDPELMVRQLRNMVWVTRLKDQVFWYPGFGSLVWFQAGDGRTRPDPEKQLSQAIFSIEDIRSIGTIAPFFRAQDSFFAG